MKTNADLEKKATDVINSREAVAYDVATKHNVTLDKVAHEPWFHGEVMERLTKTRPEFKHLTVYA